MPTSNNEKTINIIWGSLLFLMIALPVSLQTVKAIMLLLLILCSAFIQLRQTGTLFNKYAMISGILWLLYVTMLGIIGMVNSNAGLLSFLKVNYLYYFLLLFAISGLKTRNSYEATIKAVYYSNYFIAIYSFYLLLYGMGLLGNIPLIKLDDAANVGIHLGYTHVTNTNLSMTIFTFPLLALSGKSIIKDSIISKHGYLLNIIITALAMFMSGRRILWIILFFTALGAILYSDLSFSLKVKLMFSAGTVGIISIIALSSIFDISLTGYFERFLEAFSKVDEGGQDNVRVRQMVELYKGFLQHPLFGSGGGATLRYYSRSAGSPWVFEQTYSVVLFNGGIVGATLFSASFASIIFGIHRSRTDYRSGAMIALLCGLLGSATNPYITASFDFWIFVIIPLMYLNSSEALETSFSHAEASHYYSRYYR